MAIPKDQDNEAVDKRDEERLAELSEEEKGDVEHVEIEDPEEAEETGEAKPPRAARRSNRYAEQVTAREAAERERDDLRTRLIAMETMQQHRPAERREPEVDPADKAVEDNRKEQAEIQEEYAKAVKEAVAAGHTLPDAVVAGYRNRFSAAQNKGQELVADRAANRAAARTGASGGDVNQAAAVANLRARYHDISSHPQAQRIADWASGQWKSHLASGGENSLTAMDKVMEDARRVFKLTKSPPPGAATKARLAGASAGASRQIDNAPTSYAMSAADKANARSAFPHLTDKVAFQKYIQIQLKDGKRKAG